MKLSPEADRSRLLKWAMAGTMGALILAIYWPALHGTWLWDDGLEVARNPTLKDASGWWSPWIRPVGMDYFPLKDSILWLEWRLWDGRPAWYHAANLGLHWIDALLVWRLLGLLGIRRPWLGGLLFAVHPVAAETVAWIAEQKNEWALGFGLAAAIAYLDWERTARPGRYAAALAAFGAAVLSKSTIVMLPVAILCHAWWARGRIGRRDLTATAPFFGISALLGFVTLWFQGHRAVGIGGVLPAFADRLAQAGWSAAAYLASLFFPVDLAPIYPPAAALPPALAAWAGIAALLGTCWMFRGTWGRTGLAGLGWILIMLVPVLGIVPMSYLRVAPRADHLAYFSILGFAGVAAAGIDWALDRPWGRASPSRRAFAWGAVAAIVFALSRKAGIEAGIFRDSNTLWTTAIARNPRAWLPHNNLGQLMLESGRPEAAVRELETAEKLQPDSAEVHANLGDAYDRLGRPGDARREFEKALAIDPGLAGAHYDLGRYWLRIGNPARGAAEFQAALRCDPLHAAAHNNLGLSLARMGRPEAAVEEYRRALEIDPGLPEAHLNLGNVLARKGAVAEAVVEYREALSLNPSYAAAHFDLGAALRYLGREAEAEAEFKAAGSQPGPLR